MRPGPELNVRLKAFRELANVSVVELTATQGFQLRPETKDWVEFAVCELARPHSRPTLYWTGVYCDQTEELRLCLCPLRRLFLMNDEPVAPTHRQ